MRILILGGTGGTGIELIREALATYKQCTVVVYARSPEKVPSDLAQNPSVIIIKGQLDDSTSLTKALEGVDVVLSALGPSVKKGPFHPSNTPLAHAYQHLIKVMREAHVKRLILLGTASIKDSKDKFDATFYALVNGVALFARNAYKDVVAIGETIRSEGSDLDYTIARVPLLNSNNTAGFTAGYVGDGKSSAFLSRKAFASFLVGEVEKREWVKDCPLVSDC